MVAISGYTEGLRAGQIHLLEKIGRRSIPPKVVIHPSLAVELVSVSQEIGRPVGIMADRAGTIDEVVVGDETRLVEARLHSLKLPATLGRFSGFRFVHVHLRGGLIDIEDILLLTRQRLDFVAALIPSPSGHTPLIQIAYPIYSPRFKEPYEKIGPVPVSALVLDTDALVAAIESELRRNREMAIPTETGKRTRAILVHASLPNEGGDAHASLEELARLASSAGVTVVERIVQKRKSIDPLSFIGKGKLIDLIIRGMVLSADMLIFDHNLQARQANTISNLTGLKVIDRTQLILDIFAQRAQTRDGKIQVELAQLKYLMPRLSERDDALSRLTGGIGGRGPGETKLEIGRRRVRERIARLTQEIEEIARARRVRRGRRERSGVHLVALLGYTNAGKTTLLNALTGSNEPAEDKLFSTLDPRARRVRLPSGRSIVLTDTVGLIRQLPPSLFAAFRPTFEEIASASLILIILDASDDQLPMHVLMIEKTLEELGLESLPRVTILNKMDIVAPERVEKLVNEMQAFPISALHGLGTHELLQTIDERLPPKHH